MTLPLETSPTAETPTFHAALKSAAGHEGDPHAALAPRNLRDNETNETMVHTQVVCVREVLLDQEWRDLHWNWAIVSDFALA